MEPTTQNTFLESLIQERLNFFKNEMQIISEDILNPDLYEAINDNELKKSGLENEVNFWKQLEAKNFNAHIKKHTIDKFLLEESEKLNEILEDYLTETSIEKKQNQHAEMNRLVSRIKHIKNSQKEIQNGN